MNRQELLAHVAHLYYEMNLDQKAIAKQVGRSPSMVSRMLREARDSGVVDIRVHYPLPTDPEMQSELVSRFGLRQALVLSTPEIPRDARNKRLGQLGANCLQEFVRPKVRIGIGWGTSIYRVVQQLPFLPLSDGMVVQLIGSIGSGDPTVDGSEMTQTLARKLGVTARSLHAPLIVPSVNTAEDLLSDSVTRETIDLGASVSVALLGVGTADPEVSGLVRAGYVNKSDLEDLSKFGAVGDVAGYHINIHGEVLDVEMNRRVIGVDVEALRQIKDVIVVGGGITKVKPILAALLGRFFNVLVTDSDTAAQVLELAQQMGVPGKTKRTESSNSATLRGPEYE